jgi:hypothetical protein
MTGNRNDDDDARTLTGILRALTAGNVDFVVCGGVACIMQGVTRVTADLDIAVSMEDANLRRLVDAARRLGFQPRIPEPLQAIVDPKKRNEWIERKHATVFTLLSPKHPTQLDIFLQYPIAFDDLKSRANVMVGSDVTVRVSSKADLIAAKRVAGREQDERDIRDLERLIRDEQQEQPQS